VAAEMADTDDADGDRLDRAHRHTPRFDERTNSVK